MRVDWPNNNYEIGFKLLSWSSLIATDQNTKWRQHHRIVKIYTCINFLIIVCHNKSLILDILLSGQYFPLYGVFCIDDLNGDCITLVFLFLSLPFFLLFIIYFYLVILFIYMYFIYIYFFDFWGFFLKDLFVDFSQRGGTLWQHSLL